MSRILTYAEAIKEATDQEMSRDPSVVVLGQGVDDCIGMYGTTKGLHEKYGRDRVFDVPLAEDSITGACVGMALGGLRPINVHQRMDFLLLAMNQLVNIAAKTHYMFDGRLNVPMVVRSVIGRSWGQGAQHSQAIHSYFMHVPGLKVVAPTIPYDAKGCLIQSIRDDNPVIFIEHRMLHKAQQGHVPEEPYTVELGKARIVGEGDAVTIVGVSHQVIECLRAREYLGRAGISAEVIDPVTLAPLDMDTILESASRTKRLLVVDHSWLTCGASAEVIAQVTERVGPENGILCRRMGYAPVSCPTTRNLENMFYPNARTIAETAFAMVEGKTGKGVFDHETEISPEVVEFKGPF